MVFGSHWRRKPDSNACKEVVPLPRDRQPFVHPEWSATVWGRARAKLNEFVLQLPYDDVVFLSTDCVWSASVPDGIHEKQKWDSPGEFVVKESTKVPWQWPADSGDMRATLIGFNKRNDKPVHYTGDDLEEM